MYLGTPRSPTRILSEIPGPGAYDLASDIQEVRGIVKYVGKKTMRRVEATGNCSPGPNYYNVSHSLIKPSFNKAKYRPMLTKTARYSKIDPFKASSDDMRIHAAYISTDALHADSECQTKKTSVQRVNHNANKGSFPKAGRTYQQKCPSPIVVAPVSTHGSANTTPRSENDKISSGKKCDPLALKDACRALQQVLWRTKHILSEEENVNKS